MPAYSLPGVTVHKKKRKERQSGRPVYSQDIHPLVVLGMSRISQIKDDARVRASAAAVLGEDGLEVNSAIEAESAVGQDVNPVGLVVTGSVQDRDLGYSKLICPVIERYEVLTSPA